MNLGSEVGSIHASIGLDSSDLKRGLDQAKQALNEAGRMTQDATRFMAQYAQGIDREAESSRREVLVKRQQIALERELTAARSQLTAVLAQESAAAQSVAGKYSLLDTAQRQQLVQVREQITAQKALQAEQLRTAEAAERAALRQAAALQKNLGRNLQGAGRALTGAVTTPILGAAFAAGYAGQQVQQAEAGIRAGTGLTGNALQGVEESFRRVAPQVSQPLREVGQAVTELERRTGLTGAALEKLAVSELNLQRITQSGKEIFKDSAQLFTAWNVPLAEQIPILDEVNRAHQLTGISATTLMEAVTRTAPTFRAMGKSVEDSIATFSAFNKAGIVPERLITALNAGLGRLAKAGVPDAAKAMGDMLQRIQNLKDPTQALNEAVRLLGVRGGTQLADALRSGRLNLDQLEHSIKHGSDTIVKAAKDTETFSVVWGQMRNALEIALAPLGKVVLQFALLAAQALRPAVEWLGRLLEAFGKLPAGMQATILGVLAFAAALGPALIGLGRIVDGFTKTKLALDGLKLAFAEGGGIQTALTALKVSFAEVSIAGIAGFLAIAAPIAVVVGSIYVLSQHLDELMGGFRVLGRVLGGQSPADAMLQEGRTIHNEMLKRADTKFGGGGTVPPPLYDDDPARGGKRAPTAAKPKTSPIPGLTPEEYAALYGGGKESELRREQKSFTNELAQAHARLTEVLAGEDKIAAQVAGKYHLLTAAQRAQLVAVLEQIQTGEELRRMNDAIDKNTRIRTALARGESPEVARLAAEYQHLTTSQLRSIVASAQATEAAIKAAESRKAYSKDIEKLNAEIRRLKAGHDTEAGGLDALKEKYPGLTQVQLRHIFAVQQYEQALVKQHEIQKRVNEEIRQGSLRFMEQTAATRAGQIAVRLWGEEFEKRHPGASAQQLWQSLPANQQRRAKDVAFQGAAGDLQQRLDQLNEENAALRTGQRSQYAARTMFGQDLGQIQNPQIVQRINRLGTAADVNEQSRARFDAFNAPLHQMNQLIGTAEEQWQRLSEQFQAVTGRSTLARETMEKFGVVLKDLPKDTRQTIRGFFELSHAMDFFRSFASGVQNVFQNMFTNLAEHGFKGFFRNVVQGFSQMLQQMAAQYLASELASVFMNLVGPALGGLFGDGGGGITDMSQIVGRQHGGPVFAGHPYVVGERGSEVFWPRSAGTIIPHERMVGGAPITLHMTVVTQDAKSFQSPHNRNAILGGLHRSLDKARARNG